MIKLDMLTKGSWGFDLFYFISFYFFFKFDFSEISHL